MKRKQLKNFNQAKGKNLLDIRGEYGKIIALVFSDESFLPFEAAYDEYEDAEPSIKLRVSTLTNTELYSLGLIDTETYNKNFEKELKKQQEFREKQEHEIFIRLKQKYEPTKS